MTCSQNFYLLLNLSLPKKPKPLSKIQHLSLSSISVAQNISPMQVWIRKAPALNIFFTIRDLRPRFNIKDFLVLL